MIKELKEQRRQFCKDLCDELVINDEASPFVYPKWTMELAFHMIRLGWKKEEQPK